MRFSFLEIILLVFIAYGCSAPGTGVFLLVPDEKAGPGYTRKMEEGVFENAIVRIGARHVKKAELEDAPALLKDIASKGYILIRLDIRNKSLSKILYNPVYTVLTDDELDYRKPLDYTDLYDMAKGDEDAAGALRGVFYDLDTVLAPGRSASRLVIFRPLSDGVKKAELDIKEIYVGTETLRVSFPFTAEKDSRPQPTSHTP